MRSLFFSTDPAHIRCSTAVLARFTKQVAVLFGSGVPLHESLETLTRVQADSLSIFVIPELRTAVMNGHRFSSALARYPKVFPLTYIALIRGAEETGELQSVMNQLATWLDSRDRLERHVKKALTYPIFVIGLAALLTLILFQTVVPQLLETVVQLGGDLPLPTKILMGIVTLVKQPLFWIFVLFAVAGLVWYARSPRGSQQIITGVHYLPVVGDILTFAGCARFTGTMGMLLRSGVDIVRACKISADASGNPLLQTDAQRVLREIRDGRYLSEILDGRPYYPTLLIDMIKVGDETGQMAELLSRCADMMEEDTMHRIDVLMNLLEPVVLAGVSLVVGSVLIAILLPMSNMISAL